MELEEVLVIGVFVLFFSLVLIRIIKGRNKYIITGSNIRIEGTMEAIGDFLSINQQDNEHSTQPLSPMYVSNCSPQNDGKSYLNTLCDLPVGASAWVVPSALVVTMHDEKYVDGSVTYRKRPEGVFQMLVENRPAGRVVYLPDDYYPRVSRDPATNENLIPICEIRTFDNAVHFHS